MSTRLTDGELVERYLHAVLVHLPRSRRAEVAADLRRRLEDAGAEHETRAVLADLGSPEDLARTYRGAPRHLIGPRFYDTYLRVLWPVVGVVATVLGGLTLLAALTEATDPAAAPLDGADVVWDAIDAALTGGVYAAFWVTVVFAVIERTAPAGTDLGRWDPDDLPAVPHGREIPVGEAVAELVFAVVVLIGVAGLSPSLAPSFFGAGYEALDPSFTDRLVPAMVAVAVLWVVSASVALAVRSWTTVVTALSVVSDLLAVAVATAVLVHRPYFSPQFLSDLRERAGSDLTAQLNLAVGIVCIVVIVASAVGVVTAVRKHVAHRRA